MKDFIYATTTTSSAVASGGIIPLTTIARKPCCSCIELINNGLIFKRAGYYRVSGTITFTGTGEVSITSSKNGITIPALATGLTGSATTTYTLPIDGIIRVYCGEQPAVITFINSGVAITISNLSLEAEYIS